MKDTSPTSAPASGGGRIQVQRFGRFLSGMVMPNIGAFIAWGLITACFIPTGWIPNENLGKLVGPIITYLLPLLIGYTGGTMVHDKRGGVIGAVVTMGTVVGASVPMFLGAMIVGPLSAWILKQFDRLIEGRVAAGFEMLINNFSLGIIGGILALLAYVGVGPLVSVLSNFFASGVDWMVRHELLPLANVFIEPGKILFLNNAINHGVLGPIAVNQAHQTGQSILFMLESNPGPGLGLLLAYWSFGSGSARRSAPTAVIIHFFGGIHEIYFPYVLMKPRLLLATMLGAITGTLTFMLLKVGLVAVPSPGSIFAYLAMTPKGEMLPILFGVALSTVVSFLIAAVLLKFSKQTETEEDLAAATARMRELKGSKLSIPAGGAAAVSGAQVQKIVFACDAGMGSSAMGASLLRKKIKAAGLPITVINAAINDLPADADVVVTHHSLTDRARLKLPNAQHVSIQDFLKTPVYDELVAQLSKK